MPVPNETIWDQPTHTRAKIELVRCYLRAWFPILGSSHKRVLYMDGFAGPGEYTDGRDGSPVEAIRAAVEHTHARVFERTKLLFQFVEQRPDRAKHLKEVLQDRFPNLPSNFTWDVECGDFESTMDAILSGVEATNASIVPTFLFVDPFGWSGVSMKTIARLLRFNRTEVLFTFMVDSVNRWLDHPNQGENFTKLFGSDAWKAIISHPTGSRSDAVLDCFVDGLHTVAQAKYVLPFAMVNNNNRTEYFLLHASNDDSLTALSAMKAAMWQVDPSGQFRFQDRHAGQTVLWGGKPDRLDVRRRLTTRFAGQTVTWNDIRRFILLDTPYLDTHFNRGGLNVLEKEGDLAVSFAPGAPDVQRRKFTYPDGLRDFLRFHFR